MIFENAVVLTASAKDENEFNELMEQMRHPGSISEQALGEALNEVFPDSHLMVTDENERQRREAVSRQMQDAMNHWLHDNYLSAQNRVKRLPNAYPRPLSEDTLLKLPHPSQNEEYERRQEILLNGTAEQKTALVMEAFHQLKDQMGRHGFTAERLMQMPDSEIAENFELIDQIASWQGAIVAISESSELSLSAEQKQELLSFESEFAGASWAYNRTKIISSPYYGMARLEDMPPLDMQTLDQPESTPEEVTALNDLRTAVGMYQDMKQIALEHEIPRQLGGAHNDEVTWLDADGNELAPRFNARFTGEDKFLPPLDGLLAGSSLTAVLPDGTQKTFSLDRTEGNGMEVDVDIEPVMTDDPLNPGTQKEMRLSDYMDQQIKKNLTSLSADLEKADPWYIKSSPEFKALKSAMEQVKQSWHAVQGTPTELQLKTLTEQMNSLKTASEAYLGIKEENKDNLNDREQARYDVAKAIDFFAKQQLVNVRTLEHRAASRAARNENEEARKIFEEAYSDKARERQNEGIGKHIKDARSFRDADLNSLVPHKKAKFGSRGMKLHDEYAYISCPKSDVGFAFNDLKRSIIAGALPDLFIAAESTKTQKPERLAKYKRDIAELTLFHLIMAERGNNFDGTAGPLEKALAKNRDALIDSINNLPEFNKYIGVLTPERIDKFAMEDGARQISRFLIEKGLGQARQQPQSAPEKAVQKDNQKQM